MNFQNKINEKNEFFEFLSKDQFLALDENNFLWHGNENQLLAVVKTLPLCDSSEGLVGFISFWNNNFIKADQETLRFFENLKKINYNKLAVSSIFSYLKIKYQQNDRSLESSEWSYVVEILLNPKISDAVLDFLLEMKISEFLKITKTEESFMKAVRLHFLFLTIPYNFSWDLLGFSNLLKFLQVEDSVRDALINKTMNKKNFNEVQDFISKYKMNF